MIRETLFYKILSAVHIVLFTSMLCFGTIYLSGTLLMMPVLGAAFKIGKDAIYKDLDINDSIVKTYIRYLKSSFKLVKFIPINFIIFINVAGMLIAAGAKNMMYSVICLVLISFLLVFMLYIAGYYVFVDEQVSIIDVLYSILLKPQYLLPVFIIMVLSVFFLSGKLLAVLFFCGAFFLYALIIVIFIQMLFYKKALGKLEDEDKFAYLINRQGKKR